MAELLHSIAVMSDGSILNAVVDSPSDYYFLLHDDPPRDPVNAVPEMVPLFFRRGTLLTKEIQLAWFDVFCEWGGIDRATWTATQKREAVKAWGTLTDGHRAFCNKTGTDYYRNFVSETYLHTAPITDKLPKQWEVLCGGNVVKAVSHTPVRLNDSSGGSEYLQVVVWDGKGLAPRERHLLHYATSINPSGSVNPFPQLDGRDVPYFALSASPQYVKLSRVRRLMMSELYPSPYRR